MCSFLVGEWWRRYSRCLTAAVCRPFSGSPAEFWVSWPCNTLEPFPHDLNLWSESVSRSVMTDSLQPHGLYPTRFLCPWSFPVKNTGVRSHFLLQGIFPTQGSNPDLPHCRQILYQLSHKGSPFKSVVQPNSKVT